MSGIFISRKDNILFIMALLMRYIRLLHSKMQLYMIVGLERRLKLMSVRS